VLLGIPWDRMVRCRRYQNTRDGVLPTPEAGVLPSTESLQAAGRPPAHKEKAPRPDHVRYEQQHSRSCPNESCKARTCT
jgi:hypothetical protein